jgi:anti-anti-sigma factor
MDIRVTHEQSQVLITILHITGAIDSSNYQELDQLASRYIDSGSRFILLDLSNVRFMSSAALRSLQKMDRKLNAIMEPVVDPRVRQRGLLEGVYKSPYIKLLSPSEPVLLTLKTAGWDMVFDIFKDKRTAINSF